MNDREQLLQSLMRSKLEQSKRSKQAAFERRILVFALIGLIAITSFYKSSIDNKNHEQDSRLNKLEIVANRQQDIYSNFESDVKLEVN